MIDCWQENPSARPTFEGLKDQMKRFERDHQVGWGLEFLLPGGKRFRECFYITSQVFFALTLFRLGGGGDF